MQRLYADSETLSLSTETFNSLNKCLTAYVSQPVNTFDHDLLDLPIRRHNYRSFRGREDRIAPAVFVLRVNDEPECFPFPRLCPRYADVLRIAGNRNFWCEDAVGFDPGE